MHLWVVLTGFAGYLLCALGTARCAYGAQRTRVITEESRRASCAVDPVARFENHSRDATAVTALLFGLAWPVTVPCYGAYRCARFLVMAHPPETPYERERRLRHQRTRVRQLEEALGMRPDPASAQPRRRAGE
ncbi:hypothetical protein [Streptomyces sp. NPDC018693]|uniref:hypothetical protein n=1 Tax=unclassified Streptomyces TaxID=2593676 RepID=UPI0037879E75